MERRKVGETGWRRKRKIHTRGKNRAKARNREGRATVTLAKPKENERNQESPGEGRIIRISRFPGRKREFTANRLPGCERSFPWSVHARQRCRSKLETSQARVGVFVSTT